MKIKKINDLSKYEGEFTITDGSFDISGTCISLPLPGNRIPEIGLQVSRVYAFFLTDNPDVKKLYRESDHKYILKKNSLFGMAYFVQGYVLDSEKFLIKVFGFTISLEYLYGTEYCNKKFDFTNGDWISFTVDRFDVEI